MTAPELLFPRILLTLYYLVLGILSVYGAHRLLLLALYYRNRVRANDPLPAVETWPRVTVQLPLFNELYVAERLLDAVGDFDYPQDRLEIQVLDDSTDETSLIVAARVKALQSRGIDIRHLHRRDRQGYKAGALEAGLERASGELVAIFDADFVPEPDFLRRSVPLFLKNPRLGMVQACWDHINRGYSLLTRIQAIFLDGHFLIEHAARYTSGRFFNFNGTAGVWRREAIQDAGGWQQDTLTEDLDLSYRAQLKGWSFRFLSDLKAPAELPVEINAFKGQQFRWAKGSIQTARKLLGRVLKASIPWQVKLEAFVHLTNNSSYLLMVVLSLLIFPAMMIRRASGSWALLLIDLPLFMLATVAVMAFYLASQVARGDGWRREIRFLPALMGLGIGLALNNSRAVLQGLRQGGGVFERTPKYGIERKSDRWRSKRYRVSPNVTFLLEGVFAAYFLVCFLAAIYLKMWLSLPFLYLFLQGYCYIFLLSLSPTRERRDGADPGTLPLPATSNRHAAS